MPTPTPLPVVKAFELLALPTWKEKQTTDGCTWYKGKVDWCETNVAKFTIPMPSVSSAQAAELCDDDPELTKGTDAICYQYDEMLEKRVNFGPDKEFVNGRRVVALTKSPMFLVAPRDMATRTVYRYFLNDEEKQRFKIGAPGQDVHVTAAINDDEAPETEGYVRSKVHIVAFISVDGPDGCDVTQLIANEPGGSLPISLVNKAMGAQIEKLLKMRSVYTEAAAKLGSIPSPGPTIPISPDDSLNTAAKAA